MNRSFLFLADGFEEIEALTVVDVMRRAGMDIKTVSINDTAKVTGAHGIVVEADTLLDENDYNGAEWLIAPGGMPGASNLHECAKLNKLLTAQFENGGKIAAICAAPAVVLAPIGVLKGIKATSYPGFEAQCTESGAEVSTDMVVALDRIITGKGPAAATKFALAIVDNSMGESIAREVADGMLVNG